MATLEAFDKSIEWAAGGNFTISDMDESKITVFQQVCRCSYLYSRLIPLDMKTCSFVNTCTTHSWSKRRCMVFG